MSKFLCIKPGRVGRAFHRKAWTIRRTGLTVRMRWGAVDTVRGRLHWVGKGPKEQTKRFRSLGALRAYVEKTRAKRRRNRYDKLPGRTRIYSPLRRD
jgi:hypothetical protein